MRQAEALVDRIEEEPVETAEPDTDDEILELVHRRRELSAQIRELEEQLEEKTSDLEALDDQLRHLTGMTARTPPANGHAKPERRTRTCSACQQPGHIVRGKTADGRPICNTYPNGKPEEE